MFSRLIGFMAIVPASVLLTMSFFVLFVLRKVEEKELRIFGKVVAVLLCVSAGVVLACGLHVLVTGNQIIRCPMMMKHHKPGMMSPMMLKKRELLFREQAPARPVGSEKQNKEVKQDKPSCAGNKGVVSKAE